MNKVKKITVFCGSSNHVDQHYFRAVEELGAVLAENNIEVIYGGGNVGLMGALARTVLKHGGRVTGIIPRKIYDNVSHIELSDLIIVETMHERKAKMYESGDAFLALPGGIRNAQDQSLCPARSVVRSASRWQSSPVIPSHSPRPATSEESSRCLAVPRRRHLTGMQQETHRAVACGRIEARRSRGILPPEYRLRCGG